MVRNKLLSFCSGMVLVGTWVSAASALQPMSDFLKAARQNSFAAREQVITVSQRRADEDVAFGKLLPTLSARGTYTHNQYQAKVRVPGSTTSLVISPYNQWDASILLDVPLIDLANRARHDQAKLAVELAQLQSQVTGVDVEKLVARAYTSFIGASALVNAAEQSIQAAQKNLEYVSTRVGLGVGTDLDRARASSNVERAKQDRAEAELTRTLMGRTLETLSSLKASPVDTYPEDGLNPEAPLEAWLGIKDTPADKLAPKALEVAEAGRKASNYALLPVLSANAQERFTNATGFAGKVASYAIQGVLSWKLDYGTYATPDVQQRAIELQQLRTERTRRDLEDAIFEAYQRVQSGIVKSTAARAQVAAANQAASLALDRYQAGAATQIDVTQNQRDAFSASAAQIQADADLAYARALLRINAGRPVTSSGATGPAPAPPSK